VSLGVHILSQISTFIVASIFRMPVSVRRIISGIKTKRLIKPSKKLMLRWVADIQLATSSF
jgi:hypothetical protein